MTEQLTPVTVANPEEPSTEFPVLTWEVWRAKDNPRRTTLAVAFILLTLLIVELVYHDIFLVMLAILVLGLALNSYFLPTTYTFDQNGIKTDKRFYQYTRRWSEFRSFIRTTGGVVVSPFSSWTYLDNFRGVHLLLPKDPEPVFKYLANRLTEKHRPIRRSKKDQSTPS
jgi:hypothetical protein